MMDQEKFYKILDIDDPSEFIYYENVAALYEEDSAIENELISNLLSKIDMSVLLESTESYFEEFLRNLPEDESEMYLTVDSIKRELTGNMNEDMTTEEIETLTEDIQKFRKWYALDTLIHDKLNGEDVSVRDARFGIVAAKLLGEEYSYDFEPALNYDLKGYEVKIGDLVNA